MLQCCTESLSWLLDTRPCPSHTNLSNVPPLCTSTAGPHSCSALYQPHWLLAVYVCSSLPKHISIIPTQTPGGSRSIEWVGTPGDHNVSLFWSVAWWRRRILDPVSAPRGASNHQHRLTAIPVPRRDVKTLSLSATLEGRTSLADKTYLITHNSTLDPFPIQTSLQTSLNLWTDQTGKSHHKKSSML